MPMIEVVAAIIQRDDRFLCVQRGEHKYDYLSLKYEFPGGKVEENEDHIKALCREIFEELQVVISVHKKVSTVEYHYQDFSIRMAAYLCSIDSGIVSLTEHVNMVWLTLNELLDLDWAAADIPIVHDLIDQLSIGS